MIAARWRLPQLHAYNRLGKRPRGRVGEAMPWIDRCASLLLVALLAACTGTSSQVKVSSEQASDGSIAIQGYSGEGSNSPEALEASMKAEADGRCPGGWAKLSDSPKAYILGEGRIWRINCQSVANVAAPIAPTAPPPAVAATPPPAATLETVPPPVAAASPAPAAPGVASAMSRRELVRLLTISARSAGPYLTEEAVAQVVAAELRALAAARVGILGPDGQPVPLGP